MTTTYPRPSVSGAFRKKSSSAASPPADAPIPVTSVGPETCGGEGRVSVSVPVSCSVSSWSVSGGPDGAPLFSSLSLVVAPPSMVYHYHPPHIIVRSADRGEGRSRAAPAGRPGQVRVEEYADESGEPG